MSYVLKERNLNIQSLRVEPDVFPGIELIEAELNNVLAGENDTISEMNSHVLKAGGKRIRPLLVLYSGMIFTDVKKQLIQAAAAAELIHMASLVHDDIIDNSMLRRGKPSVNYKWGNQYAVLCGDKLFAKAFGVLANNRLIDSLDYMVEAIENMCTGEINQADDKFNYSINIKDYYKRIEQKTAIFLKCCCKSGAAAGGADKKAVELLGGYGLHLGYAFQIIDDILDFFGNAAAMGKPEFEDLKEGNITLPVIHLLKDEKYGPWLKNMIDARTMDEDFLLKIKSMINTGGIMEKCFNTAHKHIRIAKNNLASLPQNQYTEYLYGMADMLQCRVN